MGASTPAEVELDGPRGSRVLPGAAADPGHGLVRVSPLGGSGDEDPAPSFDADPSFAHLSHGIGSRVRAYEDELTALRTALTQCESARLHVAGRTCALRVVDVVELDLPSRGKEAQLLRCFGGLHRLISHNDGGQDRSDHRGRHPTALPNVFHYHPSFVDRPNATNLLPADRASSSPLKYGSGVESDAIIQGRGESCADVRSVDYLSRLRRGHVSRNQPLQMFRVRLSRLLLQLTA